MRNMIILLVIMLCSSCAHVPANIPDALTNQPQAVIFDIDGTLTPSPFAFFTVREDAANAVRLFADKGYTIIYLSARFPFLKIMTLNWLKSHGFPDGIVHVGDTSGDVINPYQFKKRILNDFIKHKWKIEFAYGDSCTDFEAYAKVNIRKDHVYALKRVVEPCQGNEKENWKECLKGWTEHMDFIEKSVQPAPAR
ncbi:MAG: hypothetical protein Q7U10_11610 [Thermodesulfovibrionia bacterium]|nr:hypothetical protein [Thermodesulfovibrionia bacterium]